MAIPTVFTQELEAYRVAFATSQVGAAFMNMEGCLVWTNSSFSALFGYTAEEATGLYPKTIIHPDDIPSFRQRWAELTSGTSTTSNFDRRARHKDGHYVWLNITSTLIRDAQGTPSHALLIGQDVSARKRIEQELREGKDQLSSILDSVQDVVWSFSVSQSKVFYVNAATKIIYQRAPEEFFADRDTWLNAVHPDDREEARKVRAKLLLGPTEDFYRIIRPDGEVRWVHSRAWVTRGTDGAPTRHEGIIRDVTEAKLAELAMRESETRQQLVMEVGRVGIWEIDLATRAAIWTGVFRDICGLTPDHPASPENFEALIHPDDRERTVQEFSEMSQASHGHFSPFRILRPDGTLRWIEGYGKMSKVGEGPGKLIGAIIDITEARKLEQTVESQRANMAVAAKMSALGEMAGGLAHEINNPLAIIHGHAVLLRELGRDRRLTPEELATMTTTIEQTSERISKIVKSLLTFARDGEKDPYEPVTLKSIVLDTVEFCKVRFQQHGIDFHIDPIDDNLRIDCRQVQISQVLLNLLNNAHDAVESLPTRWIRISTLDDGEAAQIIVTDSGPGIASELRDKIFQPFFTSKEIGKGTGLGLSVSKGIAEAHLGSLSLDASFPNTRFTLRLPKRHW
ncbi:MAG: PAS domain-containing sensor histidine kinase [Bdellovibrionota bacterium]